MAEYKSENYLSATSEPPSNVDTDKEGARLRCDINELKDKTSGAGTLAGDYIIIKRAPSGNRIVKIDGLPAGVWDLVSLKDDGTETLLEGSVADGDKAGLSVPEGERLALKDAGPNAAIADSTLVLFYTSQNS